MFINLLILPHHTKKQIFTYSIRAVNFIIARTMMIFVKYSNTRTIDFDFFMDFKFIPFTTKITLW